MLNSMKELSAEWKIWAEQKDKEQQAAREARRKAKEAKAAQASDTEMQDGHDVAMADAGTSAHSSDESVSSSDGDLELLTQKTRKPGSPSKSPRKRKKGRRATEGANTDPPENNNSSQETVTIAPALSRTLQDSPGFLVTDRRAMTPEFQRSSKLSTEARQVSPRRPQIVVEVSASPKAAGLSKPGAPPSTGALASASALRKDSDVHMEPPRTRRVEVEDSEEPSTEQSASEDSDAGIATAGRSSLAPANRALNRISPGPQAALANGVDAMQVDSPNESRPFNPSRSRTVQPLTQANSKERKSDGDDSFVYSEPMPQNSMSESLRQELQAGIDSAPSSLAPSPQLQSSKIKGKYAADINTGERPYESPLNPSSASTGSIFNLVGSSTSRAAAAAAAASSDADASISPYFQSPHAPKRKRNLSVEVAPSHSQERCEASETKRSRKSIQLADASSETPAEKGAQTKPVVHEISDDDHDKSTEQVIPESPAQPQGSKVEVVIPAAAAAPPPPPPFPCQMVASSRSSEKLSQSPQQRARDKPPSLKPTHQKRGTHTRF